MLMAHPERAMRINPACRAPATSIGRVPSRDNDHFMSCQSASLQSRFRFEHGQDKHSMEVVGFFVTCSPLAAFMFNARCCQILYIDTLFGNMPIGGESM